MKAAIFGLIFLIIFNISIYADSKQEHSDIYNNYIGEIILDIGGGADRYDILKDEGTSNRRFR
jgi:hypothetical protein